MTIPMKPKKKENVKVSTVPRIKEMKNIELKTSDKSCTEVDKVPTKDTNNILQMAQ
ncbi:37419_t:CDS:1, partial [Gigaspora margarita]